MSNDMLNKQLFKAVEEDRIADIAPLIKQGADVNAIDNKSGMTLLMISCLKMSTLTTVELLLNGADPNFKVKLIKHPFNIEPISDITALHVCCGYNLFNMLITQNIAGLYNSEINQKKNIEILLKSGAHIEATDSMRHTPLYYACVLNHPEAVKYLIGKGADLNKQDTLGDNPLIAASNEGCLKIVEILLQARADVNVRNHYGLNAIVLACVNGYEEIVKVLLATGCDPNTRTIPCQLNGYGDETLLIKACLYGHTGIAKMLIQAGADINAVNAVGNNALMGACLNGHYYAVKLLLDAGIDIDAREYQWKQTSLMAACGSRECPDLLKLLLDAGSDYEAMECDGNTALMITCLKGYLENTRVLIEYGANINASNNYGNTSLILAAWKGHTEIVRLLLGTGADVHPISNNNVTATEIAFQAGHTEIVHLLEAAGAKRPRLARIYIKKLIVFFITWIPVLAIYYWLGK